MPRDSKTCSECGQSIGDPFFDSAQWEEWKNNAEKWASDPSAYLDWLRSGGYVAAQAIMESMKQAASSKEIIQSISVLKDLCGALTLDLEGDK